MRLNYVSLLLTPGIYSLKNFRRFTQRKCPIAPMWTGNGWAGHVPLRYYLRVRVHQSRLFGTADWMAMES